MCDASTPKLPVLLKTSEQDTRCALLINTSFQESIPLMEIVDRYHLELLKGTYPEDHSELWKFVVSVPPAWLILHLKIFSPLNSDLKLILHLKKKLIAILNVSHIFPFL